MKRSHPKTAGHPAPTQRLIQHQQQARETQRLTIPVSADSSSEEGFLPEQDGQDPTLQPPAWLFIMGAGEILWGFLTNLLQAGTSFVGILGWQEADVYGARGVAVGIGDLLGRNLGFTVVALVLSVGAQIGIQVTSQRITKQWKRKRIEEHESTQQALIEIVQQADIGMVFGALSFLICAVSDYMFIVEIDPSNSAGSYILMTFWTIMLGCSSTYVFIDGIQRFWSGVLALRAWNLWQEALKAQFQGMAAQYQ